MADDLVNIEVNGVALKARKGQMLIQATDAHEIYVPRFCYHAKLPVAANCRMCLVEIEKAPKPMPACATPVAEGMKVHTRSPKAIAAQKAVMEFLLINHPLDCPICDQGGECELQDLAMGFGRGVSRYNERKRVVKDKDLGPLISTDMTRCIHCTRCVRFTVDIQGYQQLGTIGRGEHTEIGTFIEKSVEHELSANIIDLCPVGALNNKPYRYSARAWEMTEHPLVSPHDAVGTNLYAHVLRGRVMRIVPRPNEAVNETWIADRDRFSYQGIYSEDRLLKPMVREGGSLVETSWDTALAWTAERLSRVAKQHGGAQIGALAAPHATLEELFLLSKLVRGLGSANLDHRLRRSDFRDQQDEPIAPLLGCAIADLERASSVLIVGSHLREEMPLIAHRIRKGVLEHGSKIAFVNPQRYEYLFTPSAYLSSNGPNGPGMLEHLAAIASAAATTAAVAPPPVIAQLCASAQSSVSDTHRLVAQQLVEGNRRLILLGAQAQRDPAFADLRVVATALARLSGATLGYLPDGGNTVAAHLAGVLPHRGVGGIHPRSAGLHVADMVAARLKAYVLLGAIEPQHDIAAPGASEALKAADCVVALSPYGTAKDFAHVVLPIGTFAETSGTYVNLAGQWQSVPGASQPLGESRPAWKVLRVLGNLLNLEGFEYVSAEQVLDEVRVAVAIAHVHASPESTRAVPSSAARRPNSAPADVPIYQSDAMVRRASALQRTRLARRGRNP
jgi:NADH-quinone oxidoreductase subunit G